ncbi:hypothetical protein E3Q13_00361 [Wallemia mellicola]|uniref:DNA polymerase n=1 Tax=Wallemia mellicola TaxID=1708541 RepID=A0A4T0U1Q4_9BASI|nr:hypothetical protein E3Q13_00361 [Wallemia mellicola]TIC26470.1 hypothetical protein E3Q12_00361 [Wallemia mellicola]TIC70135.1 hypothetical protein E3Q01_00072 [Wallemia mellicola]TIC71776.1 hypothetical protein E3Q03_00377 [Wallemia mellicola]
MSTRDKLKELREARNAGGRSKQFKFEEDVDIYDEVDDDGYKSVYNNRMNRPDFIEDDDGSGYIDNGMEDDWGASDTRYDSEEDTKKRKKKSNAKVRQKESLGAYFARSQSKPTPQPSMNAYRKVVSEDKADSFMQDLLSGLDSDTKSSASLKQPPRREALPKSTVFNQYRPDDSDVNFSSQSNQQLSSDPPYSSDMDSYRSSTKTGQLRRKFTDNANLTASPTKKARNQPPSSDDFDFEPFEEDIKPPVNRIPNSWTKRDVKKEPSPSPIMKPTEPAKMEVDIEEKSAAAPKAWMSVLENMAPSPPPSPKADEEFKREGSVTDSPLYDDDGCVRFYWLDYMEDHGRVVLFGKAYDTEAKKWQSTSVTIEGIQRNLFVVPRQFKLDDDGNETGEIVEKTDVFTEMESIRKASKIKSWAAKFVKRSYAFEEKDVPREETDWLKVLYGFNEPAMPLGMTGKTFSHVFGTQTSPFELFVVKRRIMGPCWLKLEDAYVTQKGTTWCKHQFTVTDPKTVQFFNDSDADAPKEPPPLTIMSLSTRSIVNHQLNCRELVAATARVWADVNIEDPTPPEQQASSSITLVRPLGMYPPGFEMKARQQRPKIEPMRNEKAVLSNILASVQRHDPDVLVGHDLLGESLEILLNRMNEMKIPNWSKMGRVRRDKWLKAKFDRNKKITTGRLLCDLSSDQGKSMISSTTWSMTEMVNTHLGTQREDIDPDDTAAYFDSYATSPDRLIHFVKHCEVDAVFNMALAAKVQILPLTRQLTNLAGNSWGRTLTGGRSERNEFILLHEFHRQKMICPDKLSRFDKKAAQLEAAAENGDDEATTKKKGGRKDKFKGGLVFEPKKGLWDKYILVMDFNSLYPSIIQEYNIDFTTVERPEDDDNGEEKIPEIPAPGSGQGVLPKLIATLVNRRKQVKNLMKDKNATPAKLMQLDIRQMALKLTANSMYGCLGFEGSRFYARPLAALTTFKGREILTHTRELAESMQLDVVYGDTDSVFINSNAYSYDDALKVANEFKKHVNDRYKLLEIDLDGVFKRLLLLQKKKYAAIKMAEGKESTEIKGLDMKRREYSQLSKNVSQYVLDQILSGDSTEVVVEHIHDYLTEMGESIRNGKVPLDDYIINKRLGKDPEQYPDSKSQPHVQVAMRMKSKGGTAKSGDVISYVFCASPDGVASKTGKAENAYHPEDLRRKDSNLSLDYEYYITSQVLPPIERLCDNIEGTDRSRLAECLGLDPARFQNHSAGNSNDKEFQTLESQMSDKERFRNAEKFSIRCPGCTEHTEFGSMLDSVRYFFKVFIILTSEQTNSVQTRGIVCQSCSNILPPGSVNIQLEMQLRQFIAKYYDANLVCNDQSCGNKTRMMSVYGKRCLMSNCLGVMKHEYDDQMLYNQMLYFARLFDVERILKQSNSSSNYAEIQVLCEKNKPLLQVLHNTVSKFLERNARSVVSLTDIFSFMNLQGRRWKVAT